MKCTLQLLINSSKPDMGVADMIEAYRDLFEMTGGRDQIADLMAGLLNDSGDQRTVRERTVTRQMVEKWFNQKRRTIPSGILLVTLLTACSLIKQEIRKQRTQQRNETRKRIN